MNLLLSWLFGGGISAIGEQIRLARADRYNANTEQQKIEADENISRLEAARDIAVAEQGDRWSATRLGRLLIVVPFGLWWASVFMDSIFAFPFDILDLPPRIWDMATILIPAIIIADAGALSVKRIMRR